MDISAKAALGLFLLIYILPLGVRPIVIPDETRYAEAPREMLASGDWVVPHLDGLRYFEKPALGYWLNAAAMMLFGENAFAVRLPSAMAVGICACLLCLLVGRFGGSYSAAMLAAMAFLTCAEVFAVGVFNVLDSLFSLFVTAGMVAFFFAHMELTPWKRRGYLVLFGLACGLAFLTKGFLAVAISAVTIVPFLIWQRKWRELFMTLWLPIGVALLVALPWALMIQHRESDFWYYFFWTEHIKRFMSGAPQHPHSFLYFIPFVLGGGLPWTVLLPAAISGVRQTGFRDPLLRFALCWFFFPFLFFSASCGKIGTYVLPCFPPLVILISMGLLTYLEGGKTRAFTTAAVFLAGIIGLAAGTLVLSQFVDMVGFRVYGPGEEWKWAFATLGLLAWSSLLVTATKSPGRRRILLLFSAAPVLFMVSGHFIMPNLSITRKAPGEFLARHGDRVGPNTILVSDGDLVAAVCWSYRRDDVYVLENPDELRYGLSYPDSKRRLLSLDQFNILLRSSSGKNPVVLVSRTKRYMEYRERIPKPAFEDVSGGFVFSRF